jgi:hypothetical protein
VSAGGRGARGEGLWAGEGSEGDEARAEVQVRARPCYVRVRPSALPEVPPLPVGGGADGRGGQGVRSGGGRLRRRSVPSKVQVRARPCFVRVQSVCFVRAPSVSHLPPAPLSRSAGEGPGVGAPHLRPRTIPPSSPKIISRAGRTATAFARRRPSSGLFRANSAPIRSTFTCRYRSVVAIDR